MPQSNEAQVLQPLSPQATTTEPISHNYWACESQLLKPMHPRACPQQQEKLLQWEAPKPQGRVAPMQCNYTKSVCSNEGPAQPKKKTNK